tara:strand:+ start:61021 stop:61683 length:663 start_codon:yes stop_codon:yes gene_type:complete
VSTAVQPDLLTLHQLSIAPLQPISAQVSTNDRVLITGPSGIGKTRLLRAIADLDPHAGYCTLQGQRASSFRPEAWRRRVVYIPAESMWWGLKVVDHIPAHASADAATLMHQVKARSRRVGLPDDVLSWPVERLSSGQKQRLALIRALALEPDVVLLDEPTANLDADSAAQVIDLLVDFLTHDGLNDRALLFVSHAAPPTALGFTQHWEIGSSGEMKTSTS